jgi:hypothetical protein
MGKVRRRMVNGHDNLARHTASMRDIASTIMERAAIAERK